MHLSIFGLIFAILISNVTVSFLPCVCISFMQIKAKSAQTQSEDNVHLSIFCPKFSSVYSK